MDTDDNVQLDSSRNGEPVDLRETREVLDELAAVLLVGAEEDAALVEEAGRVLDALQTLALEKQARAKAAIAQLTAQCEELERATREPAERAHLEELSQLESSSREAAAQLSEVEQAREKDERKMKELKGVAEQFVGMRRESIEQERVEVPHLRHLLSLYSCVSNIQWDDCDDEPALVKGHVFLPRSKRIAPFEMSADDFEKGSYPIVNRMWEMMWEE